MNLIIDFITSKTFIAIITAFLTWILKSIYDKFWRVRPKLYISISQPLFSQRNEHYQYFSFGWRQTIKIKNNSKFTAYNIDLVFPEGFNLSDKQPISNFLKKNNHLDSNQEIEFEVESTLRIPAEEHLKYEIKPDGTRVMLPGVKNTNPQVSLMPEKVKKIKFYLKYENEKGATFHTKFTKENKNEINSLVKFKPKYK